MNRMTFPLSPQVFKCKPLVLLISAYVFVLSGCDTTFVDPFANDTNFFTIYGFLDEANNLPGGRAHAVRVVPSTRRAATITSPADPQASIDARVFVVNAFSGQETEWRHTLQRFSETEYGHVYRSNMPISQNTLYRIEVRRSDGTVTSAETLVPAVSTINIIQDPQPRVETSPSEVYQGILIPGVSNVWSIDLTYYISGSGCFTTTPINVAYGRPGSFDGEGWRFEANVTSDLRGIDIGENMALDLTLCSIGLDVRVPDTEWDLSNAEPGVELPAFSTVPSNVENGLGFFGSVGVINNAWNTTGALKAALAQQ